MTWSRWSVSWLVGRTVGRVGGRCCWSTVCGQRRAPLPLTLCVCVCVCLWRGLVHPTPLQHLREKLTALSQPRLPQTPKALFCLYKKPPSRKETITPLTVIQGYPLPIIFHLECNDRPAMLISSFSFVLFLLLVQSSTEMLPIRHLSTELTLVINI